MRRQMRGTRRTLHPRPVLVVGPVGPAGQLRQARPVRRVRRRRSLLALLYLSLVNRLALIEQILWLLVGGLLVLSVWASPRMQPRELIVSGVPPAAQQQIEVHLRHLWQRQPYSLRLGARTIESELKRFGWVAQVQMHPRFPTRLHLYIQPREPFAEVRVNPASTPHLQFPVPNPQSLHRGSRVFIDPAGIVFQPPNPPERARGGVILLSGSVALPPEGILKEGSPLWRAFELLRALSQQERYVRTIQIEADGELSLSCQAEGGVMMRFQLGDAALYQQQVQVIQLLLNSSPAQVAQWEYVDLKSPFHPAVKPLVKGTNIQPSKSSDLSDRSGAR